MQMAKALEFVHAKGFVHRDVQPQNYLFAKPPLEPFTVRRLSSFGLFMYPFI